MTSSTKLILLPKSSESSLRRAGCVAYKQRKTLGKAPFAEEARPTSERRDEPGYAGVPLAAKAALFSDEDVMSRIFYTPKPACF